MSVRCRLGSFAPFPTQLVLHSENHTLDGGGGRLDRQRVVGKVWLLERYDAVGNDKEHVELGMMMRMSTRDHILG